MKEVGSSRFDLFCGSDVGVVVALQETLHLMFRYLSAFQLIFPIVDSSIIAFQILACSQPY